VKANLTGDKNLTITLQHAGKYILSLYCKQCCNYKKVYVRILYQCHLNTLSREMINANFHVSKLKAHVSKVVSKQP